MIRLDVSVTYEPQREPAAPKLCAAEPIRLEGTALGDGKLLEGIGKLFLIVWPVIAPYLPKPSSGSAAT